MTGAAAYPHPALRATFSRKREKDLGAWRSFADADESRRAPLSRKREKGEGKRRRRVADDMKSS
jgi:hypothetical protein